MKKTRKLASFLTFVALLGGVELSETASAIDYTSYMTNETAIKTAQENVANYALYRVVFSKESVPQYGNSTVGTSGWYDYADTTISLASGGFSGALYYAQFTNASSKAVEWALVDAKNYSASSWYQLGFPRNQVAGDVVNRVITGSNVYVSYSSANMPLFTGVTANADGVKTIQNSNVILEFWPYGYAQGAQASKLDQNGNPFTLSTANTTGFDWNDTPSASGNHGSWQLQLYDSSTQKGQTIFGYSRLYRPYSTVEATSIDAGIGNSNSGGALDWTMATNTASFENRSVQMLAIPTYTTTARIFDASVSGSTWATTNAWLTGTGTRIGVLPTTENEVFVNSGTANVTAAGAAAKSVNVDLLGTLNVNATGGLTVAGISQIEGQLISSGTMVFSSSLLISKIGTSGSLTVTGGTFNAASVAVGDSAKSSGSATISGGNIKVSNMYIGNSGNGTASISGGTFSGLSNFMISNGDTSVSTLDFGGTASLSTGNFNVGYRGNGTLNMTGGTITCGGYYCIGNNISTAFGTVNQSGGTITTPWMPLGHNGKGVFNLSGTGVIKVTGTAAQDELTSTSGGLEIADRKGSNVTFNQTGGTINVSGWLYVGRVGNGTLKQSAGQTSALLGLSVAHLNADASNRSAGNYELSGGTLTVGTATSATTKSYIGRSGDGSMKISGTADADLFGDLYVGQNASSVGILTMAGGSLDVSGTIVFGENGSGKLTQTSGNITTNTLTVGHSAGSEGSIVVSGGTLKSTGTANIGYATPASLTVSGGNFVSNELRVSESGTASNSSFSLSSGSIKVTKNAYLGINAGSFGTGTLTGGTFEAADIVVGNSGKGAVTQSGATTTVKSFGRISLGSLTSSKGTWDLYDGSITASTMAVGNYGSGQLNVYDGSVTTSSWFLVGFNNGKNFAEKDQNVINQYGGSVSAGWFTLGWDGGSSYGTYNMYGGTMNAKGNGNPMVIAKDGTGIFNLYDGDVTLAAANSTNQGSQQDYVGYALKLGSAGTGTGTVNVFAGNLTATGNVSIGATSSLNFSTTIKGMGTMKVNGHLYQTAEGQITVAHSGGFSFIDENYDNSVGSDILSVTGKDALTVKNLSPAILVTNYSTDTGILNVKMNEAVALNPMSVYGNTIEVDADSAEAGWVSLENYGRGNYLWLTMNVDTGSMEMDDFVTLLQDEMTLDEESRVQVSGIGSDQVVLQVDPYTLGVGLLSWDFTDASWGGAKLLGIHSESMPEPTSIFLLALGSCGLFLLYRRKVRTEVKA